MSQYMGPQDTLRRALEEMPQRDVTTMAAAHSLATLNLLQKTMGPGGPTHPDARPISEWAAAIVVNLGRAIDPLSRADEAKAAMAQVAAVAMMALETMYRLQGPENEP